jgi:hypothetical protein
MKKTSFSAKKRCGSKFWLSGAGREVQHGVLTSPLNQTIKIYKKLKFFRFPTVLVPGLILINDSCITILPSTDH